MLHNTLKNRVKRSVWLYFLALAVCKPKVFLFDVISPIFDLIACCFQLKRLIRVEKSRTYQHYSTQNLLCFLGNRMELSWVQLWVYLAQTIKKNSIGTQLFAITSKTSLIQNTILKAMGFELIWLTDLCLDASYTGVMPSNNIKSWKNFSIDDVPFGKMTLSTYCRARFTGNIDFTDPRLQTDLTLIFKEIYSYYQAFINLDQKLGFNTCFFTEVFMEEHGAAYYALLKRRKNIIQFSGTVRDNAFVPRRLNQSSDRRHFNSIADELWQELSKNNLSTIEIEEVRSNFKDRYGQKWALSSRNQPNTVYLSKEDLRARLEISPHEKVAIIYSHILYDTMFFNGEYLFDSYADWLVKTVAATRSHKNVRWFLKVHPSNNWRGELERFLGNTYEEIRVITKALGSIPNHITIIPANTPYNPKSWLDICDIGITCTGTSGVELGMLGKSVVSAATGRYENAGFAITPKTGADYIKIIKRLDNLAHPSQEQKRRGLIWGYLNFCKKPIELKSMKFYSHSIKKPLKKGSDIRYRFEDNPTGPGKDTHELCNWIINGVSVDFGLDR